LLNKELASNSRRYPEHLKIKMREKARKSIAVACLNAEKEKARKSEKKHCPSLPEGAAAARAIKQASSTTAAAVLSLS
jgi:hypothetical protein